MPPHAMLADSSLLHSLAIGLVIAGVIILAFSFRSTLAQVFRLSRQGGAPSKPASEVEASRPAHLDAAMQDAEELAQLIADRLDRQAVRLERLIAAADDRLARLEQTSARLEQSRPTEIHLPLPPRETTDPLARQVYDLSDKGLPAVEIARQLNQHRGKVELILALRQV